MEKDLTPKDNWLIIEDRFDAALQNQRETVFTTGNGYLGTRGTFEEGYSGEQAITLVHGVFDDAPIVFTELANTPNWIDLQLYAQAERFSLERGHVLSYRRLLDLHTGSIRREVEWESHAGSHLKITFERFPSLDQEHILCVRCRVESVDYDGPFQVRGALPGQMDNNGLLHWRWLSQDQLDEQSAVLCLNTRVSKIDLCEAFRLQVTGEQPVTYEYWDSRWTPELIARTRLLPGQSLVAEKLVCVYSSRDAENPRSEAVQTLKQAVVTGYSSLETANRAAWDSEWERSNITIDGDDEADRALRYSLFQLLISAPRHDDRVSIAAKTLSGFGYRGHAFWDTEIFVLPFFTYAQPEIARNLLMYRYHTLHGARRKAKESGYEGAAYAWESAATGEEATPRWINGPTGELVRIWCGDIELHISADVAYAVNQYWHATGDDEFMRQYGAEILLDTARFWGSRVEWNADLARYEISDVIGPDENHDHVKNNAYTNLMARWNLRAAIEVLQWLRHTDPIKAGELEGKLEITPKRLEHWQDVIEHIYTGYDPNTHLFEQFEGYFNLKYLDLPTLEPRSKSVQALLGIEDAQKVQVIKQPDVLMLLYLLAQEYDPEILKANYDYYTPRTDLTFGSSLGPSIQAILATRVGDVEQGYAHFMHAARTDLHDARGNTADGIHAATDGGLWQACVFGFGGLQLTPQEAVAQAHLPQAWQRLRFKIEYRGKTYAFDLHHATAGTSSHPRFPILGAIFDLDGVLTDTSEFHYLAWKRMADEEKIPFNRQDNESLRGISRRESLLLILKGQKRTEEEMQALMERKNRYYLNYVASVTPKNLLPGAREFLQELRQKGIRIAIGSASKNARQVIQGLGIADLVDAISDGHSVQRVKPAPDLFLHAARQIDMPPEQCVVFEDAKAGVEAALAGGMWVVGVGPEQRVGAAHAVVPGLEGMRWEAIIKMLQSSEAEKTKTSSG